MNDNDAFIVAMVIFFSSILIFTGMQLNHIHENFSVGMYQCSDGHGAHNWNKVCPPVSK